MIERVIGSVWVAFWLGFFPVAAAQLPPEVMVDRYLLQTERLMAKKDHEGAFEIIKKIAALQKEHDLTLPDEFHFRSAKVAFSAGSLQVAKESVNKYLTAAGRESDFYREALELSLEIGELEAERIPCAGQPKGSECWTELVDQPKRYVWNSYYLPYKAATWTGEYLGNLAHGKGTLKWVLDLDQKPRDASPSRAAEPKCAGQQSMAAACWREVTGQPECYVWVWFYGSPSNTLTWTGECSGGLAQGTGTLKDRRGKVEEGLYVDGKKHGQWVERGSASGRVYKRFYVYGEHVGGTAEAEDVMEGLLVDGKKHGQWVERDAFGRVWEGPYVDGKRHGQWVWLIGNGNLHEGPYVEGKRHGQWVERRADGRVNEGPYVDGKKHGQWVRPLYGDEGYEYEFVDTYVKGKSHRPSVKRKRTETNR